MKILLHTVVALALTLTLVSGLCVGCVQTGAEHKCCRQNETAPSCHQPQPKEQERCGCPDTGRIMASSLEAKQSVKQSGQRLVVLAVVEVPVAAVEQTAAIFPLVRVFDRPPPDLLSLNSILRI